MANFAQQRQQAAQAVRNDCTKTPKDNLASMTSQKVNIMNGTTGQTPTDTGYQTLNNPNQAYSTEKPVSPRIQQLAYQKKKHG